MSTTATTDAPTDEQVDEITGRLFGAVLGALESATITLGQQLGLYDALRDVPGQSVAALADSTGLSPRYLREWLQSQAISGFVLLDGDDVDDGTYRLAPAVPETLLDAASPAYVGALAGVPSILGRVLPDLVAAFRSGAGVPYAVYGPEAVATQEGLNRPAYEHSLTAEWLPQLPVTAARLADASVATRVADVCCGAGWSTIRLAEEYPHLTVDGFDADEASIQRARANAVQRGVGDRVRFQVLDISAADERDGAYDIAFVFEAIHDLARPFEALRNLRGWLDPDGRLIVMDENVAEQLAAPGNEVDRFMAAVSVLWCTPQGMGPGSDVIGAVMRPDRFTDLAREAGFSSVQIAAIEHPFFRFYELSP